MSVFSLQITWTLLCFFKTQCERTFFATVPAILEVSNLGRMSRRLMYAVRKVLYCGSRVVGQISSILGFYELCLEGCACFCEAQNDHTLLASLCSANSLVSVRSTSGKSVSRKWKTNHPRHRLNRYSRHFSVAARGLPSFLNSGMFDTLAFVHSSHNVCCDSQKLKVSKSSHLSLALVVFFKTPCVVASTS